MATVGRVFTLQWVPLSLSLILVLVIVIPARPLQAFPMLTNATFEIFTSPQLLLILIVPPWPKLSGLGLTAAAASTDRIVSDRDSEPT